MFRMANTETNVFVDDDELRIDFDIFGLRLVVYSGNVERTREAIDAVYDYVKRVWRGVIDIVNGSDSLVDISLDELLQGLDIADYFWEIDFFEPIATLEGSLLEYNVSVVIRDGSHRTIAELVRYRTTDISRAISVLNSLLWLFNLVLRGEDFESESES